MLSINISRFKCSSYKALRGKVYADKLTTWCLANCNIGNDGVRDLIEYVPLNIHLNGNPISAKLKSELKETLNRSMKFKEKDDVHYDRIEPDCCITYMYCMHCMLPLPTQLVLMQL